MNDKFRDWLEKYVERPESGDVLLELMDRLEYIQPGYSFSRDEMNGH
jgi:hypothetical protein